MRIKPAPGLQVRDPMTKKLLPKEGIDVPDDSILWNRILNDGDVVLVDDKSSATPSAAAKSTTGEQA
ncbi:DUF2635 domain-containing protein [Robbsia andropogonis]|uniref:DUF2635 domain-containing protein n=1 Tax=Robbsia andropogonis TaxID=28092 RepID=UPI003D23A3DF